MRILMLAIATLLSVTLSANEDPIDKKINTIIAELKEQPLDISFTFMYSNAAKSENDVQYGKCLIKGERFHLSMSGIDTYFDGKTQWVYMAADNEVTITEPLLDEIKDLSPIAMIEFYAATHRIVKDTEHRSNDNLYVNLFPNDLEAEHFKISMIVGKDNLPRKITIHQKNGDNIEFNWDTINKVAEVDNKAFTFNPKEFRNVYINDMR